VDVATFHKAEHLAGDPAHVQSLFVHLAREGVEGAHDVGDGAVAVDVGVGSICLFSPLQ
jgi:hypothetical protein